MQDFKPILFSTPMIQAILEGRKTQTRRIMKDQPLSLICYEDCGGFTRPIMKFQASKKHPTGITGPWCPYGWAGDVLWVRETWRPIEQDSVDPRYEYKATEKINLKDKWRPSIFMPKTACRIFLEITDVRVERLLDISEADALAEGVAHVIDKVTGYCGYDYMNGGYNLMTTAYKGFRSLWRKINGEKSWNENPWVWVVEFKRIDRPEDFI